MGPSIPGGAVVSVLLFTGQIAADMAGRKAVFPLQQLKNVFNG